MTNREKILNVIEKKEKGLITGNNPAKLSLLQAWKKVVDYEIHKERMPVLTYASLRAYYFGVSTSKNTEERILKGLGL